MPDIQVSDEILSRLSTVGENDYDSASLEQTLDRLLREHQEHVMLAAAGELGDAAAMPEHS